MVEHQVHLKIATMHSVLEALRGRGLCLTLREAVVSVVHQTDHRLVELNLSVLLLLILARAPDRRYLAMNPMLSTFLLHLQRLLCTDSVPHQRLIIQLETFLRRLDAASLHCH